MEELILSVLACRSESRRDHLFKLSQIVSDTDLGEDLESLYSIVEIEDNPNDYIVEFELGILRPTYELLRRFGVEFSLEVLYETPEFGLWVLELIDFLEECEEIDEALNIATGDTEPTTVLSELIYAFTPDVHGDLDSAILSVEPRFVREVASNLTKRKQSETDETAYTNRGRKLLNFIISKPDLPFITTFENYNRYSSLDELLDSLTLTDLTEELTVETVSNLSVAICLASFDTLEEAKQNLEKVVRFLDEFSLEEHTLHNYKLTGELLEDSFVEEEDE